jgi:hypothetical protein
MVSEEMLELRYHFEGGGSIILSPLISLCASDIMTTTTLHVPSLPVTVRRDRQAFLKPSSAQKAYLDTLLTDHAIVECCNGEKSQ